MKRKVSNPQAGTVPPKKPNTSATPAPTQQFAPPTQQFAPPTQQQAVLNVSPQVDAFIVMLASSSSSAEELGSTVAVATDAQTTSLQPDVQMVEPAQLTEEEQIVWYRSQTEALISVIQTRYPSYEMKIPATLMEIKALYDELFAYLYPPQVENTSASAYQSENVEPAQLTQEELITSVNWLVGEIQKYDPEYERKIPATLEGIRKLYNQSYWY